ncbi:hypothetical protein TGME49_230940 [Toxoplasma gondii ME49]|uniref:Uncharacterized protein n=1 Tax=Toxoplasma gondii (strain ATCC 50611 / Me49) TaxID=508771 RepID=S8F2W9_TOXGM|nr:hypothetical protein TGME49_230940 [Toxoplasma gondii ME49]EPT28982.1 hypothetical protein TGME49_230940 [Toxoplasma gondii ME49]|eukprot:XP_018636864.1 hypothetical protein TGME49_230940 [Toxoplasma gondii ME49]
MAPVMTASAASDRMPGLQRGKQRVRQNAFAGSASSSSSRHAKAQPTQALRGAEGQGLSPHQQRLQQNALLSGRHHLALGSDENSITDLSPRSQKWVEDVHPLLEFFNYSKRDVYALVQRAEYDQDRVQQAVAEIVEEKKGHEQGSWEVVLTKQQKHQLHRAAQAETLPLSGREGRTRRPDRERDNRHANADRQRGNEHPSAGRRADRQTAAGPVQRRRRDSRGEAGGFRRAGGQNATGKAATGRRRGRQGEAVPGVERDWEVEALESQWGAGPDGLVLPKTPVRSGEVEGTSSGSPVAQQTAAPPAQKETVNTPEAPQATAAPAAATASPARSWAARLVQKKETVPTPESKASLLGAVKSPRESSEARKREPSPIAAPAVKSPRAATPVRDRSPHPTSEAPKVENESSPKTVHGKEAESASAGAPTGQTAPATPVLRVSPAPEDVAAPEKAVAQAPRSPSRSPRKSPRAEPRREEPRREEPRREESTRASGVANPVVIMPQHRHAQGVFLADGAGRTQSPGALGQGPHGVVVVGARAVQSPREAQRRAEAGAAYAGGEAFEGRERGQDELAARENASLEENLLTFGTVELRFCTANRGVAAPVTTVEKPKAFSASQMPSPKLSYPAEEAATTHTAAQAAAPGLLSGAAAPGGALLPAGLRPEGAGPEASGAGMEPDAEGATRPPVSPRQQGQFPAGTRDQSASFASVSSRFGPLDAQPAHASVREDRSGVQRLNEESLAAAGGVVGRSQGALSSAQGQHFAQGGRGAYGAGAPSQPAGTSRANYPVGPAGAESSQSAHESVRGPGAETHAGRSGASQPSGSQHQPLLISGDNSEFPSTHAGDGTGSLDAYYHYVGGRDFVGTGVKLENAALTSGSGASARFAQEAGAGGHQSGQAQVSSAALEGESTNAGPSSFSPANLYPNTSLFNAQGGPNEPAGPAPHQPVGSGREARGSAGERRKKQTGYHLGGGQGGSQLAHASGGFYGNSGSNSNLQNASWSGGNAHNAAGALGGLGTGVGSSNSTHANSGFSDLSGTPGSGGLNRSHAYNEYNTANAPSSSSLTSAKPPPPPPASGGAGLAPENNRLLGLGHQAATAGGSQPSSFSSYSHSQQREAPVGGQSSSARNFGQHSGAAGNKGVSGSSLHAASSSGAGASGGASGSASHSSSHSASHNATHGESSSHGASSTFTPPPGLGPSGNAQQSSANGLGAALNNQPSASSNTSSSGGPPSSYSYQGYHHTGMAYPHYNNMYYGHHGNMMPHPFGVMAGHHATSNASTSGSGMGNPTGVSNEGLPYSSASGQQSGSSASLSSSSVNAPGNALDLETSSASDSHNAQSSSSGFAQQHFHAEGSGSFSGGGYNHVQTSTKTPGSGPSTNASGSYMSYYNGSSGFSSSLGRNGQGTYQNQQGGNSNSSGGFSSRNENSGNLGVLASTNQSGGGYGKNNGGYGSKQYHGHSSYYPRGNASSDQQAAQAAAAAGYYGGYSYGQYAHPPGLGNTFYQSNFASQSGSSQGRPNYGGYNANMWS